MTLTLALTIRPVLLPAGLQILTGSGGLDTGFLFLRPGDPLIDMLQDPLFLLSQRLTLAGLAVAPLIGLFSRRTGGKSGCRPYTCHYY